MEFSHIWTNISLIKVTKIRLEVHELNDKNYLNAMNDGKTPQNPAKTQSILTENIKASTDTTLESESLSSKELSKKQMAEL